MEVKIKFRDDEARNLLWLLRRYYGSKAGLEKLVKQAIREVAAAEARQVVEEYKG